MEHINKKNGVKKKTTIQDVANMAGVAPSTVSHVINGTATISADTQEKVLDVIAKLNYSPNALARALRQKRTGLIGVVLQDISSEFYAHCAASILEEARKDNYVVLLCDASFNNENAKQGVAALVERRVDGLIFVGGGDDDDILQLAITAGVPVVLGDRHLRDIPSVEFDNASTLRDVVCALYDTGYRKFAYVGEPLNVQNNLEQRYSGFVAGLNACGIKEKDALVLLDKDLHCSKLKSAYNVFKKNFGNLSADKLPQVVLTSNDLIAHGFMSAAKDMGLNVPKDIAVIGFDDISVSEYFQPSLTTISQDEKALGKSCYQLFKSIIKGKKKTGHDILPQKIVIRESAIIPKDILANYQN